MPSLHALYGTPSETKAAVHFIIGLFPGIIGLVEAIMIPALVYSEQFGGEVNILPFEPNIF